MQAVKPADCLAALVIGRICYRTGVDDADIGFLARTGFHETFVGKLFPDGRGLCKVQLAAKRMVNYFFIGKQGVINHFFFNM